MERHKMQPELLNYPFCGGKANAEGMDGNNVGCDDSSCPAHIVNCSASEWNRRGFAAKLEGEEMRKKVASAMAECAGWGIQNWDMYEPEAKFILAVVREMVG